MELLNRQRQDQEGLLRALTTGMRIAHSYRVVLTAPQNCPAKSAGKGFVLSKR